jgi:hypothetical protein
MSLFKVWNTSRDVKKAVVASCFSEFVSKTKQDCEKSNKNINMTNLMASLLKTFTFVHDRINL